MAIRPRNQQERLIADLLRTHTKAIQEAIWAAIREANRNLDYSALIAALKANDIEAAASLFRFSQGQLFPVEEAVRSAYVSAGASVAPHLPRLPAGAFGFNGRHWRAEAWLQGQLSKAVVGSFGEGSAEAARTIIRAGFEDGRGVQAIGRSLAGRLVGGERVGSVFGLSDPIAASIERSRRLLSSGSPTQIREYFGLKLRDARNDKLVKKALRDERPLTTAEVDKIIQDHTNKAIRRRAQDIARNEAFTAQSMGREESYKQVAERPDVEAVMKRWQHNLSDPAREDHEAMNGVTIPVNEDFHFSDVDMSAPHDPRGGPKHSMGCRCVAIYRIRVAKR